MAGHHVLDVVRSRPVHGLAPDDFIRTLRTMQPRLYSIASSGEFAPGEVHVCVAPVRYRLHERDRSGVASGFLADHAKPGELVPVYVQRNDNFRLPQDPARRVVMIGAGTGVAPYRAFMQDREARGIEGASWLFFGERNFRSDFLYQAEWQDWLRRGVLGRIDLAFSRDQMQKVYVQDRIRERGAELFGWIEEGAHLYVCGDAEHMARDVHAALLALVAQGRGRGEEDAHEYLRDLQSAGRYQRDVY
jgi:sulfite reductase (NADPH) flavoprotein alpha-component